MGTKDDARPLPSALVHNAASGLTPLGTDEGLAHAMHLGQQPWSPGRSQKCEVPQELS